MVKLVRQQTSIQHVNSKFITDCLKLNITHGIILLSNKCVFGNLHSLLKILLVCFWKVGIRIGKLSMHRLSSLRYPYTSIVNMNRFQIGRLSGNSLKITISYAKSSPGCVVVHPTGKKENILSSWLAFYRCSSVNPSAVPFWICIKI